MIGAGTAAEVLAYYLDHMSDLNLVGFAVDRSFLTKPEFLGRPVAAWEDLRARFPPSKVKLIGPPTYARLNTYRRDRYVEGKAWGYEFASYVHPGSMVMTDDIGDQCVNLHGVTVHPRTRIGANVVIWSDTHVGHHCVIGAHTSCPGMSASRVTPLSERNATWPERLAWRTDADRGPQCNNERSLRHRRRADRRGHRRSKSHNSVVPEPQDQAAALRADT